jgi:dCTP deaminase
MSASSAHSISSLFPEAEEKLFKLQPRQEGILPSQNIRMLIEAGHVVGRQESAPITEEQIQPASLDLRLGEVAYRVQASFLPGRRNRVQDRIQSLEITRFDLSQRTVLERGCIYIVPLLETLNLPEDISAKANPKSTTGRLDIFTRVITDYGVSFEEIEAGYKGPLYAEIVPGTFTVAVKAGMRLSQLRFMRGKSRLASDAGLSKLDRISQLVYSESEDQAKADIDRGLRFTLNLEADDERTVVAYRAKRTTPVIELDRIGYYDPREFWDVQYRDPKSRMILDPGDFYILASLERVRIPNDYAAEMLPIDPSIGEFRSHYAGFFDPGFGYGANSIKGTQAVLEVRAHEVPFVIEHGQVVGRLMYIPLLNVPEKIYGVDIGSSYQQQGLTLSKHFRKL